MTLEDARNLVKRYGKEEHDEYTYVSWFSYCDGVVFLEIALCGHSDDDYQIRIYVMCDNEPRYLMAAGKEEDFVTMVKFLNGDNLI